MLRKGRPGVGRTGATPAVFGTTGLGRPALDARVFPSCARIADMEHHGRGNGVSVRLGFTPLLFWQWVGGSQWFGLAFAFCFGLCFGLTTRTVKPLMAPVGRPRREALVALTTQPRRFPTMFSLMILHFCHVHIGVLTLIALVKVVDSSKVNIGASVLRIQRCKTHFAVRSRPRNIFFYNLLGFLGFEINFIRDCSCLEAAHGFVTHIPGVGCIRRHSWASHKPKTKTQEG